MIIQVFISYCHEDKKYLNELIKHFAQLTRQYPVEFWYDKKILLSGEIDKEILTELEKSKIFLALISHNFISSPYCFDKELSKALEMAKEGKIKILPIILDHCSWKSTPLLSHKAPNDGQPIADHSNPNEVYNLIESGMRELLRTFLEKREPILKAAVRKISKTHNSQDFRIQRDFNDIDRSDFSNESYEIIKSFFKQKIKGLEGHKELQGKFEEMDNRAFTCILINLNKTAGKSAITVHNNKGYQRAFGDITYSNQAHQPAGSANGGARIISDNYNMYLEFHDSLGSEKTKLTAQEVADKIWKKFAENAGVNYD